MVRTKTALIPMATVILILSDQITQDSKLLMHRTLLDRVSLVAPFLRFDSDPYLVVGDDGRLFFIQDAYTPANYGTDAQTNRVIFRAIVPRIPRLSLLPLVQLVRPSFTLVTVPEGRGSATRTELGDTQLFDFAVLPGSSKERGLLLGAGADLRR